MAFNFLTTTVRTEENRKPKVNEKSILFLLNVQNIFKESIIYSEVYIISTLALDAFNQRTLTCFVRGSITVRLTSCLSSLD